MQHRFIDPLNLYAEAKSILLFWLTAPEPALLPAFDPVAELALGWKAQGTFTRPMSYVHQPMSKVVI